MKRLFIVFCMLFGVCWCLVGQNNPYGIDDECYKYMMRADASIGKDGFDEANEALLRSALEKGDAKAQNLYYVEKLRDVARREDASEQDVLAAHELCVRMSRELGYEQYIYQAYQTTKNYFFNNGQQMKAMELLQDMQRTAAADGSEYGMWTAEKEIAAYYLIFNADQAARKHLAQIISIYQTTDNPTIRRQSICQSYLDYANTFPPDADSVAFYVNKAWENTKTVTDSIRCYREFAKIAAIATDVAAYLRNRDLCLASNNQPAMGRYTASMFSVIDDLYARKLDVTSRELRRLPAENMRVVGCVAESLGRHDVAEYAKDYCLQTMQRDVGDMLDTNLSEMDARHGNDVLAADLAEKSRQMERESRLVAILVALLLLTAVIFMYLCIRDQRKAIEKDKRMIADLTAANERVKLADETKTRFIQNMSHEIRTPLNAITGFSQLLAMPDGMFPAEEKEDFSNHIINNTKMLTMLLDDIMDASAMDSGGYKISLEDAECGTICRQALSAAEHRLQPGVELKFLPEIELPFTFHTDPLRVQQVLTNLLTNACKHTSAGEIRLGCALQQEQGMMAFRVEDTGSGIPAAEAERIFERFVKLDDFIQGTGLGLSICREIAQKMGGNVWLDTAYTSGARFVFTVPLK